MSKETIESKQLAVLQKRTLPIVDEAMSFEITTSVGMERATELLSVLNDALKASEKDRKSLTDPLEASLKLIRDKYKPFEGPVGDAVKRLRSAMSTYQTEADRKAREEEAKIAARVGEGKGKFKVETAVKKIDEITRPVSVVSTETGSVRFREDKKLKITDVNKIPHQYFDLNERRLLDDLKRGTKVEGAEIEIVKTVVNR